MKPTKPILIALLLCLTGSLCLAQTAENKEHKTHDYITLVAEKLKPKSLYVSFNGEKYGEIKLEKAEGDFDYNEVIKAIKEYEKQGYELFNNNLVSWANGMQYNTYNYFLLRREHKE